MHTKHTHRLSSDRQAAVAIDYYWLPIDKHTPRGVKLQLISDAAGTATYGQLGSQVRHFTHWAPLPAFRPLVFEPSNDEDDMK